MSTVLLHKKRPVWTWTDPACLAKKADASVLTGKTRLPSLVGGRSASVDCVHRRNNLQKIPLQTGCPSGNEGKLAPDQHQEGKRRKDAGPKKLV